MVRENLISSAVTFLRDPSVINSTLDQRVAFLRSKNLTQAEIDVSLARAGASPPPAAPMAPVLQPNYGYQTSQQMAQAPGYANGAHGSYGSPPVQPRRDWRDFFIVATIATGLSYSLYVIAKRYILPLISPPTPPQLEADKASIDESFSRAFALIDQLAADTAALKQSEAQRTESLDSTMQEVETVVADLKAANLRREAESRILVDEVCRLKELVPKALEGWKESGDSRLEELTTELVSLKKLIANRVGGSGTGTQLSLLGRANYSIFPKDKPVSDDFSEITAIEKKEMEEHPNGVTTDNPTSAPALGVAAPKQESLGPRPLRSFAIPPWQLPPPAGNNTDKPPKNGEDKPGA